LGEKQKRIEKLTKEATAPDFWDDNEKAAKLSQLPIFQLKKQIPLVLPEKIHLERQLFWEDRV